MRILISTDIEGVAGVFNPQQTTPGNPEYERARRLMTAEANAAVQGAFDAGATTVYVNDSHAGFQNMIEADLDPRARYIMGKPRYLGMVAGVDLGVDGVCFIGYHSKAKTTGVLAHTINGFAFARIRLNGLELGEAGIYGALAAEYDAPVIMASGDNVFIEETMILLPNTHFVETKRATGNRSGISLSPLASQQAIKQGVYEAVSKQRTSPIPSFKLEGPILVELETQTAAQADLFCTIPQFQRLGGVHIQWGAQTVEEAVRMINTCSIMSTALR